MKWNSNYFKYSQADDLLHETIIFSPIRVGMSRQSEWHRGIGNNKRLILNPDYGSSKQIRALGVFRLVNRIENSNWRSVQPKATDSFALISFNTLNAILLYNPSTHTSPRRRLQQNRSKSKNGIGGGGGGGGLPQSG